MTIEVNAWVLTGISILFFLIGFVSSSFGLWRWYRERSEKYYRALNRIIDDDIGIYPKSIKNGDKWVYKERSDFQEGWNKACMEETKRICKIFKEEGIKIVNEKI